MDEDELDTLRASDKRRNRQEVWFLSFAAMLILGFVLWSGHVKAERERSGAAASAAVHSEAAQALLERRLAYDMTNPSVYAYEICARLDRGDDAHGIFEWLTGRPDYVPEEEAVLLIDNAIATVCTEYEPQPPGP